MLAGAIVLGDFPRSDALGRPGATDRPAQWLCNALRRQIALDSFWNCHEIDTDRIPRGARSG